MPCIYKKGCEGCSMFARESHDKLFFSNSEFGFSEDNNGACAVDEDPDPSMSCSMFEPIDDEDCDD